MKPYIVTVPNGTQFEIRLELDITNKLRPEDKEKALLFKEKSNLSNNGNGFKAGDIINIVAGYNSNINYKIEILGFEGIDTFLLWDCYWMPIDLNKRLIKR